MIAPPLVTIYLREREANAVSVASPADIVVHAVKMNEVQVRVMVCFAVDAFVKPAMP